MSNTAKSAEVDGMAALGICESLLLALTDLHVITEEAARGILKDVATTREEATLTSRSPEKHRAVVEIVQRILDGKNGTSRH